MPSQFLKPRLTSTKMQRIHSSFEISVQLFKSHFAVQGRPSTFGLGVHIFEKPSTFHWMVCTESNNCKQTNKQKLIRIMRHHSQIVKKKKANIKSNSNLDRRRFQRVSIDRAVDHDKRMTTTKHDCGLKKILRQAYRMIFTPCLPLAMP